MLPPVHLVLALLLLQSPLWAEACEGHPSGLNLTYVRLTIDCHISGAKDSLVSANLLPLGNMRWWQPPAEHLAVDVRTALAALAASIDPGRLRRLSLAGLPLGDPGLLPAILPALLDFPGLALLNLTGVGARQLPAELLRLPRLRRLVAGGNPLDCARPENRWVDLLTRLGSDLLAPAPLLLCSSLNTTNDDADNATVWDIDPEPELHTVALHGALRLPCSGRYFRLGDAGLWASARVLWRSGPDQPGGVGFSLHWPLADGNDSNAEGSHAVYRPSAFRFTTQLAVDAEPEAGASLVIAGMRQAVAGEWRCELAKNDSSGGSGQQLRVVARHRLILRPPLAGVVLACYGVAAGTIVVMILIGLLAALLRGMVRTRCCTRVVHIVEAQSVLHLDASPQQTRRRRQATSAAAAADSAAAAAATDRWGSGEYPHGRGSPPGASSSSVVAFGCDDGDFAGPSGAAGWRDRLRGINDQMRLHVTSFGESVGSTMRAGWTSGVEHVKEQMRSVAEFCGTNEPLGQTVSVVSVYTDPEGRQEPMEQHLHLLSSV